MPQVKLLNSVDFNYLCPHGLSPPPLHFFYVPLRLQGLICKLSPTLSVRLSRMYDRRGDEVPPFDRAAEAGFFQRQPVSVRWREGHLRSHLGSAGPGQRLAVSPVIRILVSCRDRPQGILCPIFHSQFVQKLYFLKSENSSRPWIRFYRAARTYQNRRLFFPLNES